MKKRMMKLLSAGLSMMLMVQTPLLYTYAAEEIPSEEITEEVTEEADAEEVPVEEVTEEEAEETVEESVEEAAEESAEEAPEEASQSSEQEREEQQEETSIQELTPMAPEEEERVRHEGSESSTLHEMPMYIETPEESLTVDVSSLPEKYDLRDVEGKSLVTSVKDQGTEGLCWAYSTIAIAESSLLKNSNGDANVSEPDFSEHHLGYFTFHQPADPLNLISRDQTSYGELLTEGGDTSMAAMNLSQWRGPALQDTPLDDAHAYDHEAILKDFILLKESTEENRNLIKNAIMKYGAMTMSICANQSAINSFMDQETSAYCVDIRYETDHAVTIVGWDDTYSLQNFKESVRPVAKTDGAWICKNSWGTWFGDNGYFYVSYNDPSIGRFVGCSMAPADTYDNNYQYDGSMGGASYGFSEGVKMANIFKTKDGSAGEILKAIGYQLSSANSSMKFTIYKNLTDVTDPESGEKVYVSGTVTTDYPGYHTEDLTQEVKLEPGTVFSVVLEAQSDFHMNFETTKKGSYYTYEAYTEPNQSFYGQTGFWHDLHEDNQCLRIKALTSDLKQNPPIPDIPEEVKVSSITLNKSSLTLNVNDTFSLTATVLPENAANKALTWTSSNSNAATVNAQGVVTAVGSGQATITAAAADGSGKTAQCQVTVRQPVTGITLDKTSISLNKGQTYTLKATLSPADADNKTVTWASSNSNAATVNAQGVVTAVGSGQATITATAADGSGVKAQCQVTVRQPVTGITLDKTSISLNKGQTYTLKATLSPADADNKTVTWESSNNSAATVNAQGVVTAVESGQATITATAADGSGVKAQCQVTVEEPITEVKVTSITLDKQNLTLKKGENATITATVLPENATNKALTWTSSNSNAATVDAQGVVTAVESGQATITATAADGSGVKAQCQVTVVEPVTEVKVTSITLDKQSLTLKKGENAAITATVLPENATNKALTWTSSNKDVATVNEQGVVTAVGKGKATITATAADGSGKTAQCQITVRQPVTKTTLNKSSVTLNKGRTYTLKATLSPTDADNKAVTWTSSNTKIATVDKNGVVKAIGGGEATITAAAADGSGKKAQCKVIVRYNISYVLNGGKNSVKNPAVYYNQYVKLYNPTRKGYVFAGWYTNKNLRTGKTTSIAKGTKGNRTFYAKWQKVTVSQVKGLKLKNSARGKMTVSFKAVSGAKYRIQVYDGKTRKTKYYYTNRTSYTVSGLKKGVKYTVKVSAYKTDSLNNKVYGKVSGAKSLKLSK